MPALSVILPTTASLENAMSEDDRLRGEEAMRLILGVKQARTNSHFHFDDSSFEMKAEIWFSN